MPFNAEIEAQASAMTSAAAKDALTNRIASWWQEKPSWAAIAEGHRRQGLHALRQLQVIIPPAEGLETLLKDIQYF